MKKYIQLSTALLFTSASLFSQVNVTGGSSATYANVNAAFAAINTGTHFGAITIDITANTTEPSTPTPLLASGQSAANYTSIILRPTVPATISGVMVTGKGVLELDGVDNFTIDGDIIGGPVNRDLTISNNAAPTIAATAAIRLIGRTTLGLGATNNSIMNCVIMGNTPGNDGFSGSTVANSFAIYAGANSANLTTTGIGDNYDNLTIQNNEIKRAFFGIYIGGTTTGTADNVLVDNNICGSNNPGENLSFKGILLNNAATSTISLNEVFNMKVMTANNNAGIEVAGTTSSSVTISRNKVYGIWSTSNTGYGAYGISLIGGNNHICVNNVIYDIMTTNYSATTTTWNAFGIRITVGTGHKIYYNSINMFGNYTYTNSSAASAALLIVATTVTGLDIRNNIFANKMTSTATTKKFHAVWFPAAYNFLNAVLDNNAYMINNDADHFIGKIGVTTGTGEYANLSTWQAISQVNNPSNDINSVPSLNVNAPFVADNNLTIPTNAVTPIESGAVLIASLGTNIDHNAALRPLAGINPNTNPDMGAYEFDGLAGVATDAGVQALVSPSTNGCYGASENLVVTIKNYGTASISNIPVTVTVSGAASQTTTATYSGIITAGASVNFTVGTLNMLAAGVYSFNASTALPGDLNLPNDGMVQTTRTVIAPVALPQTVSFTGFSGANLTTMFPNWHEANTAIVPTGTASLWTSQTGLNGAGNITARINLLTTTRNEWIVGPKISATSASQISFDAAVTDLSSIVNSDVMGSDDMVRLMVSTDCGISYAPIYTISATNSLTTNFTNFTVPLSAYAGQDIIVAFLATDGPIDDIESYDFHLDNINLYSASATDAGIAALAAPTSTACFSSNENIIVDIKNYGIAPISNIPVTVTIAGPIPQVLNGTYIGSIGVGSTVSFIVGTANMSIGGVYTFTSVTSLLGDANTFNDVTVASRTVSPIISISGNTSLCSGSSGTLTAMGTATSYTWSTSSTTNTTVITPTANTTYTVIGMSVAGCTTALTASVSVTNPTITGTGDVFCGPSGTGTLTASAFATVNWYSSPTSTVSLASGNTYVPPVTPVTITYYAEANSISQDSLFTTLAAGNGFSGNMFDIVALSNIEVNSFDMHFSSVGTGTIEVWYRVGSFIGFESSNVGWTLAYTTTVITNGTGSLTKIPGTFSVNIPAGQTYGFYVTALSTGPQINYTNGTILSNVYVQNSDLQILEGKGGGYFTVTNSPRVFNGQAHYSVTGCTSPRIPVTLTVSPSPTVSAISSPPVLCSGKTATLTASGASTYSWTSVGTGPSVTVSPTANTVYTVVGTNSAGCTDIATVNLPVNPSPTVTAVSSNSILCVGQTATLTAGGANTYTWTTAATGSVTTVSPTITTTYSVQGTNSFGCKDFAVITQTVSACTGIENSIATNNGVLIYPNPAKDEVTVFVSSLSKDTKLKIYNALGQTVISIKIENNETRISVSDLAKGIYIYRIEEKETMVKQGKLIKE